MRPGFLVPVILTAAAMLSQAALAQSPSPTCSLDVQDNESWLDGGLRHATLRRGQSIVAEGEVRPSRLDWVEVRFLGAPSAFDDFPRLRFELRHNRQDVPVYLYFTVQGERINGVSALQVINGGSTLRLYFENAEGERNALSLRYVHRQPADAILSDTACLIRQHRLSDFGEAP